MLIFFTVLVSFYNYHRETLWQGLQSLMDTDPDKYDKTNPRQNHLIQPGLASLKTKIIYFWMLWQPLEYSFQIPTTLILDANSIFNLMKIQINL